MASTSILPSCSILSSKHLWAICLPRTLSILKPNLSFGFAFLLLTRDSSSKLGFPLICSSVDFVFLLLTRNSSSKLGSPLAHSSVDFVFLLLTRDSSSKLGSPLAPSSVDLYHSISRRLRHCPCTGTCHIRLP